MSLKAAYEAGVESQLMLWDSEIEDLQATVDIVLAQMENRYYRVLRELRSQEKKLRTDLQELKSAPEDGWEEPRAWVADDVECMEQALTRAARELGAASIATSMIAPAATGADTIATPPGIFTACLPAYTGGTTSLP